MSSVDELDWLAFNMLPGIGPLRAHRLIARYGDPGEIAFRVPANELAQARGVGAGTVRAIVDARRSLAREAERERRRVKKAGARVLILGRPGYPAMLETLDDPPFVLYLKGELPDRVVRVAVVGARHATAYGRRVATGLASGLAERGIEVVSGGARGIDGCAHHGALEVEGRTVAVLGSGLSRPYPAEHEQLFERIAGSGALLSELPLEQPPLKGSFPRRNRLISGLSTAVVVVEAAERSGSLVTAMHAAEQGREVLAVPGPVTSSRSVGCHRLILDGARLVQNVDDVVRELSPLYRGALPPQRATSTGVDPDASDDDATPDEQAVLALLDPVEPSQLDDLADRAPFGFARLQTALFGLELRGVVESLPGGRYLLTREVGLSGSAI